MRKPQGYVVYNTARVNVSTPAGSQDVQQTPAHSRSSFCSWAEGMFLRGRKTLHPNVHFVELLPEAGNLREHSDRVRRSESHHLYHRTPTHNPQPGSKLYKPTFTVQHEQLP